MIDHQHGSIIYACDTCPETLDTGESEWSDAKITFDEAGWRAEKVGPE